MAEPFRFERSAREPRALALLGTAAAALVFLVVVVGAAWWVTGGLALLALPAALDALRGARATLAIDDRTLSWSSGRRGQDIPLDRLAEVQLATTLDFSQRASLLLSTGQRLRIPPECLPPGRALDAALARRGISYRRSLFGF
jgi:hypothetical protein